MNQHSRHLLCGPGGDPRSSFPRYQYAGGWGYEADLLMLGGAPTSPLPPVRLLHVGARWYEPDIGRFGMRVPMGIDGGSSLYGYVLNDPIDLVDPTGQNICADIDQFLNDTITGTPMGVTSSGTFGVVVANYKYKCAKLGRTPNVIGAVCAGAYLGWKSGEDYHSDHKRR